MCEVQGEEGGRGGKGDVPLYHSIFFLSSCLLTRLQAPHYQTQLGRRRCVHVLPLPQGDTGESLGTMRRNRVKGQRSEVRGQTVNTIFL